MEAKLQAAVLALPEPETEFSNIAQRAEKKKHKSHRKRHMVLAAAFALCLLITACTRVAGSYQVFLEVSLTDMLSWMGVPFVYSDPYLKSFEKALQQAAEYNYVIPKTLGGSPYQTMYTHMIAPDGASRLEATLNPAGKILTIGYHIEKSNAEGNTHWSERGIGVQICAAENDLWKPFYYVAEDGTDIYPGNSCGTVEYEGMTLYVSSNTMLSGSDVYYRIRWEDKNLGVVIAMTCSDLESPEEAVKIAKELIDLNRK